MEEGGDSFYIPDKQHNTDSIDYKIGYFKANGCDSFFDHEEYSAIQDTPKQISDSNNKDLACGAEAGIWITLACILAYYARYSLLKKRRHSNKAEKRFTLPDPKIEKNL